MWSRGREWVSETQLCPTLCNPMEYSPWNSPGHNTGVGTVLFSKGSSQPRDHTQIFHIAGGFFTSWATREAGSCGRMYSNTLLHCTSDQGLLTTPRAAAKSTGPANTTVHCSAYLLLCPSPDTTVQHLHSTPEENVHLSISGVWVIPAWDSSSLPLDSRILHKLSNLGRQLLKYS